MTLLQRLKNFVRQCRAHVAAFIGRERIDRINHKITYYPDKLHAAMPEWSHRFIDPIKPYLQNPRFVWRFTGTVIVLLLTFIGYRMLHENTQHQLKDQAVTEQQHDEIEAPAGGFNPDYVRSVTVHAQNVDDHLLVPGRLLFDADEVRKISARVSGRVEQVFIHEGYPTTPGQAILSLYSPDFLAAEQEYLLASKTIGVVSGIKDSSLAADARDLTDAARNKLRILGMSEGEIAQLGRAGTPLPVLTVRAPINGILTSHVFKPGAYVNLGDEVATVASLSPIWFKGNVYEQDIGRVRLGQPMALRSDAYPGQTFNGTVDFIAPSLDPDTHTLEVRATLNNPGNTLKPAVYVTGVVTTGTERRVVIPKEALIKEGNNAYVIQVLPGNHYKLRSLSVSPLWDEDTISVLRGLNDGDEIVTTGSVLVYESIKRKIR